MGSLGAQRAGAGGLADLERRAREETNPNRVLNSVPWNKLGSNFQSLNAAQKSAIAGVLALTKGNVLHFVDNAKNNPTVTDGVRIDGVRYGVTIGVADGNVVYTLKKGNKNLVKNGTYENVANQLAVLINRSKKK